MTRVTGRLWTGAFHLSIALAGAATMVVELAAVRLLAPWFGASTGVWTNVIGVILLGLSLGYLTGARLAARGEPARGLAWSLSAGALCTGLLPLAVAPTARWFLPPDVALHEALGLVTWGSLAVTGLVFLPASVALGCVGPLAVELLQTRRGGHAGTAGGRVLASSTLGSLAGTFATTHLLVPRLGLHTTFLAAAGGLLLVALFFALQARRPRRAAGILALAFAALLAAQFVRAGSALAPELPHGVELLAQAESPYQSVRVVEDRRDGRLLRQLQVNEGFDSFQSVWQPEPGLFGPGFYYDLFALPTWWDRERDSWRVLVLGFGAGSAARVLKGAAPERVRAAGLAITGVEIDPVVVALGRAYLDVPHPDDRDPTTEVLAGLDARVALEHLDGGWDYAILDAYAHQVEIPAHVASREFFETLFERLAPGGWLGINVGGFGFADPVVAALGATVATASGRPVLALRVPQSRNYVLFARRDAHVPEPPWRDSASRNAPESEIAGAVRSLEAQLEFDGAWHWIGPEDGELLTDDHCPLERLQAQSLARARELRRGES